MPRPVNIVVDDYLAADDKVVPVGHQLALLPWPERLFKQRGQLDLPDG